MGRLNFEEGQWGFGVVVFLQKFDLLHHVHTQTLTTQNLVFMAGQISRGMYHLTRKGLMHRDLAARNI